MASQTVTVDQWKVQECSHFSVHKAGWCLSCPQYVLSPEYVPCSNDSERMTSEREQAESEPPPHVLCTDCQLKMDLCTSNDLIKKVCPVIWVSNFRCGQAENQQPPSQYPLFFCFLSVYSENTHWGWRQGSLVKSTGYSCRTWFPAHICWFRAIYNSSSRTSDALFLPP